MFARKISVVDAEGKATGNARLIGVRTYIIKSQADEIQRRRPVYTATNSKDSQPYDKRYDHPPEVHDILSKIMSEVNRSGPPPKSSDPKTGTYNQGRPYYGYDYSPNDQGGYGAPNYHLGDYDVTHRSLSPTYDQRVDKFPKTKNGSQVPYEYESPDSPWGDPEARDKRVPSKKWDKLSSPAYDQPRENPEKRWEGSAGKTQTPKEYEVPSNQWERSMTPESPREYGVTDNPRNQWGSPPVKPQSPRDFVAHPSNPQYQRGSPPIKSQSPREYGVASDPTNQWGMSPVKPESHGNYVVHPSNPNYQNPGDYGSPSNQQGRPPSPKYQRGSPPGDYGPLDDISSSPKNQWGSSHVKPQSPREYGVASPPMKPQSPREYGVANPPVKPQSPREYGVASDPKNKWGSSPLKPESHKDNVVHPSSPKYQSPGDYGSASNQHGRPSSPKYQRGSPPGDYGPLDDISSNPKNQWASPPVKPQSPREYGVASDPKNKWGSSPLKPESHNDYVAHPSSPKYQSPGDYGSPSNQHGRPSSPKYQRGSPPSDYGSLDDISSSPKNQWGSPPVKPQSPREYGVASDPKNKWGNSPLKSESQKDYTIHPSSPKYQSPGDYGSPNNQHGRPSSPKSQRGSPSGDYGPLDDISSSPKNQWASPPVKPQSPRKYGVASDPKNKWGSSPLKPESPKDYVVDSGDYGSQNNQHGSPSSPESQKGSPPTDYRPLDDISSSPKNQWASPPVKPQSPWGYGAVSDPMNKGGSSPVKPESHKDYVVHPSSPKYQSPKDYGSPSNQHGRPSSPVYDNPQKSSSKTQLRSSPLKPDGSEEGWRSSNPYIPDHQQLEKNTNQKLPSGSYNDMGQTFNQLSLDSPRGTVGVTRRYESGKDLKRTLTSKEALEKYNGSFVPK